MFLTLYFFSIFTFFTCECHVEKTSMYFCLCVTILLIQTQMFYRFCLYIFIVGSYFLTATHTSYMYTNTAVKSRSLLHLRALHSIRRRNTRVSCKSTHKLKTTTVLYRTLLNQLRLCYGSQLMAYTFYSVCLTYRSKIVGILFQQ